VPIAIATDHNPGSSPTLVAAADAEHGLHAVSPDAEEAWRASPSTPRARSAWRPRPARHRPARRLRGLDADHPRELATVSATTLRRVVCGGRREHSHDRAHLHPALRHAPLLVSFPHVGTLIPADQRQRYTERALQVEDTDWFLDRLYDFAADLGASLIVPRTAAMSSTSTGPATTSHVRGQNNTELCPTRHFTGEPLYRAGQAPDDAEIRRRVASYWQPYTMPARRAGAPARRAWPRRALRQPQHQERAALALRRPLAAHEPGHRGRHELRAGAARPPGGRLGRAGEYTHVLDGVSRADTSRASTAADERPARGAAEMCCAPTWTKRRPTAGTKSAQSASRRC